MESLINKRNVLIIQCEHASDIQKKKRISRKIEAICEKIIEKQDRIDNSANLMASAYLNHCGGKETPEKIAKVAYLCSEALEKEREMRINEYTHL